MNIYNTILAVACSLTITSAIAANINVNNENTKKSQANYLSMLGNAHLQHHPTFFDDIQYIKKAADEAKQLSKPSSNEHQLTRRLGKKKKKSKTTKSTKATENPKVAVPEVPPESPESPPESLLCDPDDVNLLDYPQWEAEKGYWIGEYTFMQGDGSPYVSTSWNYPYGHYKGFITGEVVGNSYRQRNMFLYPPQVSSMCGVENAVVGSGECGRHGNTKVFQADQSATTCSSNEVLGGDIEGPYIQGNFVLPTKTELVGQDNALLYQVFVPGDILGKTEDVLLQSQLTTITKGPDGQIYRTRTAQSFDAFVNVGSSTSASYYRERRVTQTEFYAGLESAIADYNIQAEDLCAWDSNNNPIANVTGSLDTCKDYLEQSFALGSE